MAINNFSWCQIFILYYQTCMYSNNHKNIPPCVAKVLTIMAFFKYVSSLHNDCFCRINQALLLYHQNMQQKKRKMVWFRRIWGILYFNEIFGFYSWFLPSTGTITCLAFCNDSHMLSGSEDGTICIWECKSWECLKILKGHR